MGEGGRLRRSRRGGGTGKAYISLAEGHCILDVYDSEILSQTKVRYAEH